MQFFATIGVIAAALPVLIGFVLLGIIWRTWWLYPVWGWFIVPLGVPAISFWHFAALLTFFTTLVTHTDNYKETREFDWSKFSISFLTPVITWALMRWIAGSH